MYLKIRNPLHPNINNILQKESNYFPKQKQKSGIRFYFRKTSFISDLIEDSWIVDSASVFNLLWYHTSCSLWKTLLLVISIFYENSFDLMGSLAGVLGTPQGTMGYPCGNCCATGYPSCPWSRGIEAWKWLAKNPGRRATSWWSLVYVTLQEISPQ